jgi:hypothetical protein
VSIIGGGEHFVTVAAGQKISVVANIGSVTNGGGVGGATVYLFVGATLTSKTLTFDPIGNAQIQYESGPLAAGSYGLDLQANANLAGVTANGQLQYMVVSE